MKNFGFSLIELLVTVAILGIIASMAVAQYSSYKEKAYDSHAVAAVKNMDLALEAILGSLPKNFWSYYGGAGYYCTGVANSDGVNSYYSATSYCNVFNYGFQGTRGVFTYFNLGRDTKAIYSTHCLGSGGSNRMKFFEIVNGRMRSFYRNAVRTSTEYCYGFQGS